MLISNRVIIYGTIYTEFFSTPLKISAYHHAHEVEITRSDYCKPSNFITHVFCSIVPIKYYMVTYIN